MRFKYLRYLAFALGGLSTVVASGAFVYNTGTARMLVKTTETTIDTTGALALDLLATWGSANASNTITAQAGSIEEWTAYPYSTVGDTVILESGDALLLETGDLILTEG